mgnify:FL=1
MILDDLFRNLTNYNGNLNSVEIENRKYRTKTDFNPSVIIGQAFGAGYDENSYNQIPLLK